MSPCLLVSLSSPLQADRSRHTRPQAAPSTGRGLDLGEDLIGQLDRGLADVDLRLGHEIHRPKFQGPQGRLAALLRQRGNHDHGQRMGLHELLQKGQSIHAWHFHVQGQHIGVQLLDLLPRGIRVAGSSNDFKIRVLTEQLAEQLTYESRIVDD